MAVGRALSPSARREVRRPPVMARWNWCCSPAAPVRRCPKENDSPRREGGRNSGEGWRSVPYPPNVRPPNPLIRPRHTRRVVVVQAFGG